MKRLSPSFTPLPSVTGYQTALLLLLAVLFSLTLTPLQAATLFTGCGGEYE